jgi:uncharacterized membrane protein
VKLTAPLVVAGWGGAIGLLTALLAGMGGSAVVVGIFGGAVAITEVMAVSVLMSRRRRPARPPGLDPPTAGAFMVAAAAFLALIGLAFGFWTALLAIPLLVGAVIYEAYVYRKRGHLQARR